jgi:hypothetical protein
MRERREFRDLGRVDVGAAARWEEARESLQSFPPIAGIGLTMALSSVDLRTRSATTRRPATQTSVTASRPTAWTKWDTGS